MTDAVIVSVQVGMPRVHERPSTTGGEPLPWTTGYLKEPVRGPVRATTEGLAGDGHTSGNHGGPDQAALVYCAEHYDLWESDLGERYPCGGFAENLTVSGIDEKDVCVGDVWATDDVVFRVSQPRGPCDNIARFHRRPDLLSRVIATGRTGWYLRVLREGAVRAGDRLRLVERPHPAWTAKAANAVRTSDPFDRAGAQALLALPELGASWRRNLEG